MPCRGGGRSPALPAVPAARAGPVPSSSSAVGRVEAVDTAGAALLEPGRRVVGLGQVLIRVLHQAAAQKGDALDPTYTAG